MRRRGSAFISALVVSAVLTALVSVGSARLMIQLHAQGNRLDGARAERLAASAVENAVAVLQNQDQSVTTEDDEWIEFGQAGEVEYLLGQGGFRLEIIDAGSRINLNQADEAQLGRLPLEQDQVASLLDWREAGLQARVEGAKDEYYNGLVQPYNTRLGRLESVEDILLVKGFDGPTLYLPPSDQSTQTTGTSVDTQIPLIERVTVDSQATNTGATGQAKPNINTATLQQMTQAGLRQQAAQAIIQRRNSVGTFTNLGAVFQTPGLNLLDAQAILDGFTTTNETTLPGRVNLNTATESTLATLGLQDDIAQAIIARQRTLASIGEVATIPGVTLETLTGIADHISVGSGAFIVRAIGRYGRMRVAAEATIVLGGETPRISRFTTMPATEAIRRWQWQDQPLQRQEVSGQ